MPIAPELPAAALLETWQHLIAGLPQGWARAEPGALAAVTGVAIPTLNGVWVESEDVDVEVVANLLDQVGDTGMPYCLQVRPGGADQVTDVAAKHGMTREEHAIPLMVLEDLGELGTNQATTNGLVIRELTPVEAHLHARLAAVGFEAPVQAFVQLMRPSMLAVPGVRCYLGEVDGEAVTTGLGVTLGSYVAIFNIATPPGHRRHGYGSEVTARAVADGMAAGATWAWLQSSDSGYRVYERLGFRTTENWSCWLSSTTPDS